MYYDTREIIKRLCQRSKLMFLNGVIREVYNFNKTAKYNKLANPNLFPIGYSVILEMIEKICLERNEKIQKQILDYYFGMFVVKTRKYCKTQLKFFKSKFELDENVFWIPVDKFKNPYFFDVFPEDEDFKLYSEKIPIIKKFEKVKDFKFKNKIHNELVVNFSRFEYKKIIDELNNLKYF